ncbi:hypothetical protein CEXT_810811 [Caerostris extrusa]|uniref:Uncharacterized protein n=1 Tax=Caerostris extrusa TaxID=172846 RepID=A0AAV4XIC3_CAEEX|nr:hypothetical protein CEXT_810811 [Caerostris extrusa]
MGQLAVMSHVGLAVRPTPKRASRVTRNMLPTLTYVTSHMLVIGETQSASTPNCQQLTQSLQNGSKSSWSTPDKPKLNKIFFISTACNFVRSADDRAETSITRNQLMLQMFKALKPTSVGFSPHDRVSFAKHKLLLSAGVHHNSCPHLSGVWFLGPPAGSLKIQHKLKSGRVGLSIMINCVQRA